MAIIANASFDDAIKTVVKKVDFKNKPFETLFGVLGVSGIFFASWKLGIIAFIAEHFGYGPGLIGKFIDNALKSDGGVTIKDMSLTSGSLASASESTIDKLRNLFSKKSEKDLSDLRADYILSDIFVVKGSINKNDLLAAIYANKNVPITKQAIGRVGFFKKFFKSFVGGRRLGLASLLYGLLKRFVIGLAGLGIVGGVLGVPKETSGPPKTTTPKKSNLVLYANEKGSVQSTLIYFLNRIYQGFSKAFKDTYGISLFGSPQMEKILSVVRKANGDTSLFHINEWKAFNGPPIEAIAKALLPVAHYEDIKPGKQDEKEELKSLLRRK